MISLIRSASIIVVTLLVGATHYAAAQQPVVLLKGRVHNNGRSPGKVDINFKDESGAMVRASSDDNGTYQTVLKPGRRYAIVITDENLVRYTFSYALPAYDRYTELSQDFPIGVSEPAPAVSETPKKTSKKAKSKKSKKGK